jgi:hypothetical protein
VLDLARQVRALIAAGDGYRSAFARRTGIGLRDTSALDRIPHPKPASTRPEAGHHRPHPGRRRIDDQRLHYVCHDIDRAVIDAHPTHLREVSTVIERITAVLQTQGAPPVPSGPARSRPMHAGNGRHRRPVVAGQHQHPDRLATVPRLPGDSS